MTNDDNTGIDERVTDTDTSRPVAAPTGTSPQPTAPVADAMSWADASAELRRLVAELDDPNLDIDLLAGKVERAAALVAVCRSRIERAREQINTVILDIDDI